MFENAPVARNEGLGIRKEVRGFENVFGVRNGVWSLKGGSGRFKARAWGFERDLGDRKGVLPFENLPGV